MTDDVIDVIKAQHREIDALLGQAMEEGADTASLLRRVSELLLPHSQAEESFVYPTIAERAPDEGEEVEDGVAEHHHIEQVLQELLDEDPDAPGFDGKLAALVGELRHHVEEEEQDLLPVLSEQASDEDRAALGARFARETGWTGSGGTGSGGTGSGGTGLGGTGLGGTGSGGTGSGGTGQTGGEGQGLTREELYDKAKEQDVAGRSRMTKAQLQEAVDQD